MNKLNIVQKTNERNSAGQEFTLKSTKKAIKISETAKKVEEAKDK